MGNLEVSFGYQMADSVAAPDAAVQIGSYLSADGPGNPSAWADVSAVTAGKQYIRFVLLTRNPADATSAWSLLTLINYPSKVRQDFIFGCANDADGRSVVVWEYGESRQATIYGATCDLADPTTWAVLGSRTDYPGSGISDEASGEYAQLPCCTLSDAGELGLFFVRTDGSTTSPAPVAIRFRLATL